MRLLKIIYYMDETAANQLAQEILDETSDRASKDEELLEFARKTIMRTY